MAGCSLGTDGDTETRSDPAVATRSVAGVELYPIPRDVVVGCRGAQDQARVSILCPAHLPRPSTGLDYTALAPNPFGVSRLQVRGEGVYGVSITYNAETGDPQKDRPERFLHFDLQVRGKGFSSNQLPPGVRPARLGGRRGLLAPASSRGYGGEPYFANHVRFFWNQGRTKYAATLHNFGPNTRAVLDGLVAGLRPTDQLEVEEPPLAPGVQRVPVPVAGPVSVATNDTGVWVAGSRALSKLRPDSLEPASEVVKVRAFQPSLAADREVWVAHPASYSFNERGFPRRRGDALQRLHPTGRHFARSIRAGTDLTGVALGHGSIWVADLTGGRTYEAPRGDWPGRPGYRGGTVRRIDPRTGRIVARIPVGGAPAAIAVGEGRVWATNNLDDTITEIDPGTNEATAEVAVGNSPTGIATGEGATWAVNSGDDTVSRIEPGSANTAETVAVGRGPRGVAVGEGSVWVSNYHDDTVSRIDPATNEVIETIRVGSGPVGIAFGQGAVWVATIHDRALFRIDPQP